MNFVAALGTYSPALANIGLLTVIFGIVAWWVRGMADRKRASTEAGVATTAANSAQYDRLEREIDRLTHRVTVLEKAGEVKDETIAGLVATKLEMLAERAAERVLATAVAAEKDATIAGLRARLGEPSLALATEHVAAATERVADAAEAAVKKRRGV